MRKALILLSLMGCGLYTAAVDAPETDNGRDFKSLISWCIAVEADAPAPLPTPPGPADKCSNCNGTGRVGDGTVSVTCPVCDGTGKKKTTDTFVTGSQAPVQNSGQIRQTLVRQGSIRGILSRIRSVLGGR